jgi:hypothetical protein
MYLSCRIHSILPEKMCVNKDVDCISYMCRSYRSHKDLHFTRIKTGSRAGYSTGFKTWLITGNSTLGFELGAPLGSRLRAEPGA